MHFRITAAAAFALLGSTLASPAPVPAQPTDTGYSTEDVTITNFSLDKDSSGTLTSVSFTISGNDASGLSCSATNPVLSYQSADRTQCGDTDYYFNILRGTEADYAVAVTHAFEVDGSGTFSGGQYGQSDVATSCSASNGGQVCTQSQAVSMTLTGQ